MSKQHYDYLVLGLGGAGSAALYHLARRGLNVGGLDRFPIAHDRGSSHGHTRLIRESYFEHPSYVPLVQRAFELWEQLSVDHGRDVYYQTGIIEAGPDDGELVAGVLASAAKHGLDVEQFTSQQAAQRWPQFAFAPEHSVVYEQRAGFLLVEQCVSAHVELAQWAGAETFCNQTIKSIESATDVVRVMTEQGEFTADRVIVTLGSWVGDLIPELSEQLTVLRKPLHWFRADESLYSRKSGCPSFLFETESGHYYGFPASDWRGLKVARHTGGDVVDNPLTVNRELDREERDDVQRFLKKHLPGVTDASTDHTVCMYTMSPDGHFIIDRCEDDPRIVYAAGLSGHGFKFTAALGEVLADLVTGSKSSYDLSFFSRNRLGN
ncbi:MAG: N-methyl-L-tryptophan oxidase [Planctomycetaceae bacterium]|nr:N-methyl-L-tryptophan oxidase [Planctomycetaceae bacterium]